MWLLAALAALPFAEIALFVVVGARIGAGWTVALVLLAMVAGAIVIRREGVAQARRLGQAAAAGVDPAALLTETALRLFAGFLLIAPGFLSDALAIALLVGPTRRALVAWAKQRVDARVIVAGRMRETVFGEADGGAGADRFGRRAPARERAGDIPIDADYIDVTDAPARGRRAPGPDG
jgi:UPF0716 protein FxsA